MELGRAREKERDGAVLGGVFAGGCKFCVASEDGLRGWSLRPPAVLVNTWSSAILLAVQRLQPVGAVESVEFRPVDQQVLRKNVESHSAGQWVTRGMLTLLQLASDKQK